MSGVRLTRTRAGDGPALVASNLASRALHHPWVAPPTDMAAFETWFARLATGGQISLIARTGDDQIAGVVNINGVIMGAFRSGFLGYYGMAGSEGRGLMTEALRQAVAFAFEDVGLHRLEANIQPQNARSIALVKRLGFRLEGFSPRYLKIDGAWRDHERWAILADD